MASSSVLLPAPLCPQMALVPGVKGMRALV